MLAAMVSSLMSSLASVFNSCATLYTMDLYLPRYPRATPKELVKVGRMTVGGSAHSVRQAASHSFTHSLIHLFIHSLIHSFTHSLIHSLTHSLTHALTQWPVSQPVSPSVLSLRCSSSCWFIFVLLSCRSCLVRRLATNDSSLRRSALYLHTKTTRWLTD